MTRSRSRRWVPYRLASTLRLTTALVFATWGTSGVWGPGGGGCAVAAAIPWQKAPIWNDGKAEVNAYKATEIKYGVPREFTAYFIVVAEDLRSDTLVKANAPKGRAGLIRVLKMNQVYDIPTGLYDYRQMASVFLRVSDLSAVKESVTSHEWCGNTFALLRVRGSQGTLRSFSYFDGEAEGNQTVDLAGATLYDALPLAIRAVPFGSGLERRIRIASQLLDNHLVTMKVSDAKLSVEGIEPIATSLGTLETWRVDIKHPAGTDQFWIERDAPNRLVQWYQADGGKYLLQSSRRLAYWSMHDPGDEKALEVPPDSGVGR